MRWLDDNREYESVILEDFRFCLYWITSDQIRTLNKWFKLPDLDWKVFREEVKNFWEANGQYAQYESVEQTRCLLNELNSKCQDVENLFNWFLHTQLTPGYLGKNMISWIDHMVNCMNNSRMDTNFPNICNLYTHCIDNPYSSYVKAANKLEQFWMQTPGYRTDWDDYLYEIYFKELSGDPTMICDDELRNMLFREFWYEVVSTISEKTIIEFETELISLASKNERSSFQIDADVDIKNSFGMNGFLPDISFGITQ